MKIYHIDGGKSYKLPDECCVFCTHCTDVYWDYTHGIYMLTCDINSHAADFGNLPNLCKYYNEDNNDPHIERS